jgi:DNA-directed RNA polymerase specialized sigma24 family protein
MKEAVLTPEDFDRLLLWLDPNRAQAALQYEKTRHRLIIFFAGGGCRSEAERLADEAFDRVSQKLKDGQVAASHDRDKVFYFLGFARNIRHEYLRKSNPTEVTVPLVSPDEKDSTDVETELECLDQCISELPTEKHWVVMEYYQFEGLAKIEHRRKIANQLGIDVKTLRLRVHRIREQLKPCIEDCFIRSGITS